MRALVEYGRFDGGPWRRPQRIDAGTFVEHFRDVTTLEQSVEPQLAVLDGDGAAVPEHAARIMHGQVGMVTRLSVRNAHEWACAKRSTSLWRSPRGLPRESQLCHCA